MLWTLDNLRGIKARLEKMIELQGELIGEFGLDDGVYDYPFADWVDMSRSLGRVDAWANRMLCVVECRRLIDDVDEVENGCGGAGPTAMNNDEFKECRKVLEMAAVPRDEDEYFVVEGREGVPDGFVEIGMTVAVAKKRPS